MRQFHYIYLHGFASSPYSTKAQYLRDRFLDSQIFVSIPDLNQGDFSRLTLTRQIQQIAGELELVNHPVTLIGSSLGGLTATWVAQKYPQVQRLILLAPAFGFAKLWLSLLGEENLKNWQQTNTLPVYHYGEKRHLPLHYQFIEDTSQYQDEQLQRPIPTLILHGRSDEVVPLEFSHNYAQNRPWVNLIELESDHSLTDVLPQIWQEIQQFLLI